MPLPAFVRLPLMLVAFLPALATPCTGVWDGDEFIRFSASATANQAIALLGPDKQVKTFVNVGHVRAFHDAKRRIAPIASRDARFLICDGAMPNAFAARMGGSDVIGVSIGMLKLVNSDPDMAAYVVGHELGHHTAGHGATSVQRSAFIDFVAILAGVALERHTQGRYGGLALDVSRLGGALVARKFDRDQEREADDLGIRYMTQAGFNPHGAINLARRMIAVGLPGGGLFFDSHPGWEERALRTQTMIAGMVRPDAGATQNVAVATTEQSVTSLAIAGRDPIALARIVLPPSRDARPRSALPDEPIPQSPSSPDMLTAIMKSDRSSIRYFLSQGIDVNQTGTGSTYLIAAVQAGDVGIVRLLLDAGADINRGDRKGYTPLLHAKLARPADPDLIEILVAAGGIVQH